MLQYLQPIIDYIHQNPGIGVLITFIVAMAESLPLIGTIIPGSITMTAIGTLVGTGLLPGYTTLVWASFGAFVGDTIGFGCGFLFTDKVRTIWPFKKYPHWLELSEKFFEKHGGKSIIIGRFVGPARSTVPLVAGLLKIGWWRFTFAAIPSAIMWAVLYMVPGILIGALAVELPPHIATEFILVGLATVVILWLIFWAIQYFFAQLAHAINLLIDKFWDALIRHKPSRPFIRLIAVKGKPTDHYQLTLSILSLLSSALFLCVFYSVFSEGWLTGINQPLFHLMQSLHTRFFDQFFIVISLFGKSLTMLSAGILVSIFLMLARQWRAATHILVADFVMAAAIWFVKHFFYNPRPTGFQYVSPTSSFPSGHTGMSFIVICMLAYFSGKLIKPSLKWIPYTLASILILLIATSRLYLGAHWITDILGSITLGFAVLFAVIVNYRRRARKQFQTINKWYWLIAILISLAIPWTISSLKNYQFSLFRYKPVFPTVTMTQKNWWNNPTRYLPLYRHNRFGEPIQPFNLEWSGSLTHIQSSLQKLGWTLIDPKYSVKGTIRRFVKKQNYNLPLFPWLYHHKTPSLILMKNTVKEKRVIELRLWPAAAKFKNSQQRIWIGTINYHLSPSKKVNFSRFKDISLKESGGIKRLIIGLRQLKYYQYKLIHIPYQKQPEKVQALNWDGHIIIIRKKTS